MGRCFCQALSQLQSRLASVEEEREVVTEQQQQQQEEEEDGEEHKDEDTQSASSNRYDRLINHCLHVKYLYEQSL